MAPGPICVTAVCMLLYCTLRVADAGIALRNDLCDADNTIVEDDSMCRCKAGWFAAPTTPPSEVFQCVTCADGFFVRLKNGTANEDECVRCESVCSSDQYANNCAPHTPGTCMNCTECSQKDHSIINGVEYAYATRFNCSSLFDSVCWLCLECTAEQFATMSCFAEGEDTYTTRQCHSCQTQACVQGQYYTADCGHGSAPPDCHKCSDVSEACSEGHYRVGCTGNLAGECVPIPECQAGQWRNRNQVSGTDCKYCPRYLLQFNLNTLNAPPRMQTKRTLVTVCLAPPAVLQRTVFRNTV